MCRKGFGVYKVMVSSISTSNYSAAAIKKTSVAQKDVKTLVKYMNGETLATTADTFGSNLKSNAGSAAFFEGASFLNLVKNTKISTGKFTNEALSALGETNKAALKNVVKGEGSFLSRVSDFVKTAFESNQSYSDIKTETTAAAKAAKAAAKAGVEVSDDVANAATKAATKVAGEVADDVANAVTKTGVKGFLKSSGAGFMLAINGIVELFSEVVPTFKELGAEKGFKQLGKSSVKVLGNTAGYVAGNAAGVAAGTAIGTALCPGIGTAIGAACGFIGGMLGSWGMGKLTDKITGESERTITANKASEKSARKIAKDSESLEELKNSVVAKLEEEAAANNGQLSEDSLLAYQALQNLDATV